MLHDLLTAYTYLILNAQVDTRCRVFMPAGSKSAKPLSCR